MSFRIRKNEPVQHAVVRIVGREVDRAIAESARRSGKAEAIHSGRRRCKRIRAVLRLVRPQLGDTGFAAIEDGLKKIYAQARTCMRLAHESPSTEAMHEWRKRVKDHAQHVQLLRSVWKEPMRARGGGASPSGRLGRRSRPLGAARGAAVVPRRHGRSRDGAGVDRLHRPPPTGAADARRDDRRARVRREAEGVRRANRAVLARLAQRAGDGGAARLSPGSRQRVSGGSIGTCAGSRPRVRRSLNLSE